MKAKTTGRRERNLAAGQGIATMPSPFQDQISPCQVGQDGVAVCLCVLFRYFYHKYLMYCGNGGSNVSPFGGLNFCYIRPRHEQHENAHNQLSWQPFVALRIETKTKPKTKKIQGEKRERERGSFLYFISNLISSQLLANVWFFFQSRQPTMTTTLTR